MGDGEEAFHQQVAQKIWNQVMECNVFLRNERFPKEIFETLYREYGGRLAKTVGEGTGETCSGCGRANTWHPECPTCMQLTKLEVKLAKAREAIDGGITLAKGLRTECLGHCLVPLSRKDQRFFDRVNENIRKMGKALGEIDDG